MVSDIGNNAPNVLLATLGCELFCKTHTHYSLDFFVGINMFVQINLFGWILYCVWLEKYPHLVEKASTPSSRCYIHSSYRYL